MVTVKDEDGNPVAGVSATTDADGLATLNLLPGVYEIVLDITGVEGNYVYSYPAYTGKNYAVSTTTVNLVQLHNYSYTVICDGVAVSGLTFNYDGKTYTTDADGKITILAESEPHYYGQFSLDGTDYEGYSIKYSLVNPLDDYYTYSVTLKAPLPPATQAPSWGTLSDNYGPVVVTERTEFTFVLDEAPMDVDGYECYIDVTNGYIESVTDSNGMGLSDGNESNTWYCIEGWMGGTFTFIVVPTGEGETTVTFTYGTV